MEVADTLPKSLDVRAMERIVELEAENRRMREALEQCLGNLKVLGAENGWGAEAARAALSQEEKS